MRFIFTGIIAIVFTLSSIHTSAQNKNRGIHLKSEKLTLDSRIDFISNFYSTTDFHLISNIHRFQISQIDTAGNLIKMTGRRGQGPGEFQNGPSSIIFSSTLQEIAVIDQTTNKIKFYDQNLQYKKDLIKKVPIFDIDYDNNGNLLAASLPKIDLIESIYIYGKDKNLLNKFSPKIKPYNILFDAFLIKSFPNKKICLVFINRNLIQLYNYEGDLLQEYQIKELPERSSSVVTHQRNEFNINELPTGRLINDAVVENNKLYLLLGEYTTKDHQQINVYDVNGNNLKKYILDRKAKNIYLSENFLIFSTYHQHDLYRVIK